MRIGHVSTPMISAPQTPTALLALRSGGSWGGLNALYFTQAGSLAFQVAQIKQLGPAHLVRADDLDLVNHFGMHGKNALHTLAEADLAHGETALGATAQRNHGAFKSLYALFVAFLDPDLNANGIARIDFRNIGATQFGRQFFHNGMLRHRLFLLMLTLFGSSVD